MDTDGSLVTLALIGIFFYFTMFIFFSLPNVIFSIMLTRQLLAKKSILAFIPLLFPVAGVFFYLTIDFFELNNLEGVWFGVLALISYLPAFLYYFYKKKHQSS